MKKHFKTNLEEVFSVSQIVTIYPSIRIGPYRNLGVIPNEFWQIIHTKDEEAVKATGNECMPLKKDTIVFRGPQETIYVGAERNVLCERGIISFECSSPEMEFFRGKIFPIGIEEKKCLQEIYSIGEREFEAINIEEYHGCRLRETCTPITLQRLKNTLERLLFLLYMSEEEHAITNEVSAHASKSSKLLVRDVERYFSEHISEKLDIDSISKHFLISSSKLKNAFREVRGKGVITCFLDFKVEESMHLLEENQLTIEEISEKTGFDSPSYFSRIFSQKVGVSPSEYRKSTLTNLNEK